MLRLASVSAKVRSRIRSTSSPAIDTTRSRGGRSLKSGRGSSRWEVTLLNSSATVMATHLFLDMIGQLAKNTFHFGDHSKCVFTDYD